MNQLAISKQNATQWQSCCIDPFIDFAIYFLVKVFKVNNLN